MKRTVLASNLGILFCVVATATPACSTSRDADSEPVMVQPVPPPASAAQTEVQAPKLPVVPLKLVEAKPVDIHYQIPGSDSRIALSRTAATSYDVTFITDRGDRRILTRPSPERPINPIVESRSYGATNITCSNSFADGEGKKPMLECFLLATSSGEVIDKIAVDDVWLRTTAVEDRVVFVSPHTPIHADPGYVMSCRGIYVNDENRLVYDSDTIVPCSDKPPTGITDKDEIDRINADIARVPLLEHRKLGDKSPMTISFGNDGTRKPSGPASINQFAMISPGNDSGGDGAGDGDQAGLPDPEVDPNNCGGWPESNLQRRYLGKADSRVNQFLQENMGMLSPQWILPDYPAEGMSVGIGGTWEHEGYVETDTPLCLVKDEHQSDRAGIFASVPFIEGEGDLEYNYEEKSCTEMVCTNKQWGCDGRRGDSQKVAFGVGVSLSGVVPLDHVSAIRWVCFDGPDQKWFKPKKACQAQFTAVYQVAENTDMRLGFGGCGSKCADHRLEKYQRKSSGFGGAITIEVEASWGWFGSGRIGISASATRHNINTVDISCFADQRYEDTCHRTKVRVYGNFSIAGLFDTLRFDQDISYYASPDCPPEDRSKLGRPTFGTYAGGMCKSAAGSGGILSKTRCLECCKKHLNQGDFAIVLPGETEQQHYSDCKAACDSHGGY
jgi:hypothetical protein